jgi:hypothetical protein
LNSASTFWRTCDAYGQNCHCDWRLSLYSCAETVPVGIIFKIQAIWAAIVAVLGKMSSVIYHIPSFALLT